MLYVCKQTFRIFKVRILKKVKGIMMRNQRGILYMKTNLLQGFHICISAPLKYSILETKKLKFKKFNFKLLGEKMLIRIYILSGILRTQLCIL